MAAHKAPLSLGFSRQEHWSGLPFPSPMQESEKWKWNSQSCPTSSDPMDCSLPGSSVHGIFQARVLEWGAIAFSASYARDYANSAGDVIELCCQRNIILPPRGHLTMFGDIIGCHNRGEGCYWHLVSRGQRCRSAYEKSPWQWRILQSKMSVMLRWRSPTVEKDLGPAGVLRPPLKNRHAHPPPQTQHL